LEWAHQNRLQKLRPLGPALCRTAATYGRIAVLEWLDAKGVKANRVTLAAAAEGGQLETLKWLRDRGAQLWELFDKIGDYPPHIKAWLLDDRRIERHAFEDADDSRQKLRASMVNAISKIKSLDTDVADQLEGLLGLEDNEPAAQEEKLTTPDPEGISVQEESGIMSVVKIASFGPKAYTCKVCDSRNSWETREEVINHCVDAHGFPTHLAQDFVDAKVVPPCKKMGCGLCCTGLGPGNHKFLDKKGALEHLVQHLVDHHGFSFARAIEQVEAALPDDNGDPQMMAMIRQLQCRMDGLENCN
jgi:hypothetical protein